MKKTFPILLCLSIASTAIMSSCGESGSSESPLSGGSTAASDLIGTWMLTESYSMEGCTSYDTVLTTFVEGGSRVDINSTSFKCSGSDAEYDKSTSTGTWAVSHDTLFTTTLDADTTERDTVRFGVKGTNLYLEGKDEGETMTVKFVRFTP